MDKQFKGVREHWNVHFGHKTADLRGNATAVSDTSFRTPGTLPKNLIRNARKERARL